MTLPQALGRHLKRRVVQLRWKAEFFGVLIRTAPDLLHIGLPVNPVIPFHAPSSGPQSSKSAHPGTGQGYSENLTFRST